MHKTTLEQWSLLEKVVEAGSFAKAAEETHRSQSSVSYNGVVAGEAGRGAAGAGRTTSGANPCRRILLNQVKPLLKAFSYVETRAGTLRNGMRTRLDLVVDTFSRVAACSPFCVSSSSSIHKPRYASPKCWKIRADAINDEADVMVLTRRQDMTGLGEWLMNIDFVAVAHHPASPFHPRRTA
jgi:DNA-binding transcriptional LysR family regulator